MRILYVEDHQDTAFVVGKLLQSLGHEVELATTCARARDVLRRKPVDVLISDLALPDGDGCGLMREAAAHYGIPGIALTGHAREEDIAKARAAGFCEHLAKPIDFTELVASLERCMPKASTGASTGTAR